MSIKNSCGDCTDCDRGVTWATPPCPMVENPSLDDLFAPAVKPVPMSYMRDWSRDEVEQDAEVKDAKGADPDKYRTAVYMRLAGSEYWHQMTTPKGFDWRFGTVYNHRGQALQADLKGDNFRIRFVRTGGRKPSELYRRTWRNLEPAIDLREWDYIISSTSSGKDSQAMCYEIARLAEQQGVLDRVITVHSDLGSMEWPGESELAQEQAALLGVEYVEVSRIGKPGSGRFRADKNSSPLFEKGEPIGDLLDDVWHRWRQLQQTGVDWEGDDTPVKGTFDEVVGIKIEVAGHEIVISPDSRVRYHGEESEASEWRKGSTLEVWSTDGWVPMTIKGDVTEERPKTRADVGRQKAETSPWFSQAQRYCTSYAKRDVIKTLMIEIADAWHEHNPEAGRRCRILDCQGMRGKESNERLKKPRFWFRPKRSSLKREVWTWLPLQPWTEYEVWDAIAESGLPYHPAYDFANAPGTSLERRKAAGMPRLSCVYCVFAPQGSLVLAATFDESDLMDRYIHIEDYTGFTFRQGFTMTEIREQAKRGGPIDMTEEWNM
jgi:Phosphoadenosine phosphosulfate reductase family